MLPTFFTALLLHSAEQGSTAEEVLAWFRAIVEVLVHLPHFPQSHAPLHLLMTRYLFSLVDLGPFAVALHLASTYYLLWLSRNLNQIFHLEPEAIA